MHPTAAGYAATELWGGVKETPGPGSTLRVSEYLETYTGTHTPDDVPWCSAFMGWCQTQAGVSIKGTTLAARSWLQWGHQAIDPRPGDVAVLWRGTLSGAKGHVGFWLGANARDVYLLGGNQGDRVSVAAYDREMVLSYRRGG